jgi:adenosylhomocysteine nucleosidase
MGILIAAALERELGNCFANDPVIYTGVGKINAAYSLTKEIGKRQPKLVFNLGTAGSRKLPQESVVLCTRFFQRDMDVSPLGFPVGVTPYSDIPQFLDLDLSIPGYAPHTCSSGDNFVTAGDDLIDFDVFDMEAYSLALICKNEKIPFICLKYVTDDGSEHAAEDWKKNLERGPIALQKVFREVLEKLVF